LEGGIALDYRYAFEKSFVKSGQNQKKNFQAMFGLIVEETFAESNLRKTA
jgi:hypothetical protein